MALHEANLLSLATDRATQLLGWTSNWDFGCTISATVQWYRAVAGENASEARQMTDRQISAFMNELTPSEGALGRKR
jgi:CDP-glucose 4,6-dehydratase